MKHFISQYWPLLLLVAWFDYKVWNSRCVRGLLPALKAQGETLIDVRQRHPQRHGQTHVAQKRV